MNMQILVAGATGKTGRLVMQDLIDQGHHAIALIRDGSDTSALPKGAAIRRGDLTMLAEDICDNVDAVIFAAGSGSKTGPDMTEKVDRDGAKALVDAAKAAQVGRFVMLSTIGADQSDPTGDLAHYLKAKHDADEHLKASGLTYAILRPVALTDDARGDQVILGDKVDPKAKASRADVAHVLAKAVVTGDLDGQAKDMQSA
jgi:uncharacterized protein YbjT (DUF2867 family)